MFRVIFAYLIALIATIFGVWSWQKSREEEIRNDRLNGEIRRLKASKNYGTESGDKCVICFTNPFEILFQPCGHVCLCQNCTVTLAENCKSRALQAKCPICRKVISASQRIYLS